MNFEPELLARADGLATIRGWSRSRLIREALQAMLAASDSTVLAATESTG